MEETKKEITDADLQAAIKEEIADFLRRHRDEIVKRAHSRLRQVIREENEKRDA